MVLVPPLPRPKLNSLQDQPLQNQRHFSRVACLTLLALMTYGATCLDAIAAYSSMVLQSPAIVIVRPMYSSGFLKIAKRALPSLGGYIIGNGFPSIGRSENTGQCQEAI